MHVSAREGALRDGAQHGSRDQRGAQPVAELPEVRVSSGLIEQRQFDAPGSVQAIDAERIRFLYRLQIDRGYQKYLGKSAT